MGEAGYYRGIVNTVSLLAFEISFEVIKRIFIHAILLPGFGQSVAVAPLVS